MTAEHARAIHRLTHDQCGVVRRDQLYDLGVARRTLYDQISRGRWIAAGRRVLILPGTADTLLTRSLVAAHAVHPDGQLTGWSALAARGWIGERPWNAVAPDAHPWLRVTDHRRYPDAHLLRVAALTPGQRLAGVLVASRDEIVTDLLRYLPPGDAKDLGYQVAQDMGSSRLVALLADALAVKHHARGMKQLRQLVGLLADGAHSEAEQRLVQMLKEAGFTGFIVNHPVRIGRQLRRIDVAFPDVGVAVEIDGRAWHVTGRQFQRDRTRQTELVIAGWKVLTFTWEDLIQRPDQTLHRIAEMTGQWDRTAESW